MISKEYQAIFNNVTIAAAFFQITLDEAGNISQAIIQDCNQEYLRQIEKVGIKREQLINQSYFDAMPEHDPRWHYYFYQAAIKRQKIEGEFRTRESNAWIRIAAGPGLEENTCWMTFSDFTAYKNENERLSELSKIDHLSGVKNRNAYEDELKALEDAHTPVGVILVDLNSLKEINDLEGHQKGDYLIEKTAKYLTSLLDDGNLPYRIGGDEFVLLLNGESEEKTKAILHQIRTSTDVSLSSGAAWSDDSAHINEIIKRADEQMYHDKKRYYQTHSRRKADQRLTGEHRGVNTVKKGNLKQMASFAETLPFGFIAMHNLNEGSRIITANEKFYRYCGYDSLSEMIEATHGCYSELVHPEDYQVILSKVKEDQQGAQLGHGHMFFRLKTKSGDYVNAEDFGVTIEDPNYGRIYILYSLLSDESKNRNIYDPVTGLHERHYLVSRIEDQQQYNQDQFKDHTLSIIAFNICDFRLYNEHYGFKQGDYFLIRFASLLKNVFKTDWIMRTYADHFIAFYEGDDVVEKVQQVHAEALKISRELPLWVEAGIYLYDHQKKVSLNKCVEYASEAMQAITNTRKKYYIFYTEKIADQMRKKQYIQTHLEEAIQKGWIQPCLQPVMRTLTGKMASFELLSHWNDPVYGMIPPSEFMPVLEEKNISYLLATFVIEKSAQIIAEFEKKSGLIAAPVSINFSRKDFDMIDAFAMVEAAVAKYGIARHQIIIEITESTAMEKPRLIRHVIAQFHQAGYQVWMDDFGSSYSSLNALKDFDFDEIKLDMAFMHNLDKRGKQIIISSINMAKKLHIHTLCEGVETKEQLEFLKSVGCEKVQGFYYSHPLNIDDMCKMIHKRHFVYEGDAECQLFDRMSSFVFDTDSSWMLAFVHDGEISTLYISQKLKKAAEDMNQSQFFTQPLKTIQTPLSQKIAAVIKRALISGQKEYITYFTGNRHVLMAARRLSAHDHDAICEIAFSDATKESAQLRLTSLTPLEQVFVSMYDSIYMIDFKQMTLEVILSDFIYENIGTVVPFVASVSARLIDESDRSHFLAWLNRDRINDYFRDPSHHYDYAIFRIRDTIHHKETITKVFTLIKVNHQDDQFLLCLSAQRSLKD